MAEDIYFNKKKKSGVTRDISFANNKYTERIDRGQLNSDPGNLSFNDIKTETGYIKAPDMTKQKKKRKKKSKGKIILGILVSLFAVFACLSVVLALGASAAFSSFLGDYEAKDFEPNVHVRESDLTHSDDVYNILLMGIDTLNTDSASRSDAMILMSLDTKTNAIKLTSFLRDSYVTIPGFGDNRLNAACVYGGPQLVCDTIEYNFGIRIDDYAKVGYDMFIKIIDAVGGVTIPEIDETEAKALKKEGFEIAPATNVKLDGYHALLYCRIRSGQNDFYRTGRQREVITQFFKELPSADLSLLISTAKEIAQTIECSIEKREFFSLFIKALPCLMGEIEQFTIPADGAWHNETINYMAVLVLDFTKNKEMLTEFLYK